MDSAGNLYGTTENGGRGCSGPVPACSRGCPSPDDFGCGTVFRLAPDGTETVLYTFCSQRLCKDGSNPLAGLIMDGAGNLYGTTEWGGASRCWHGRDYVVGCGTVFKVDPTTGTETEVYSFQGAGMNPLAGLIMDGAGNLYGTTQYDGVPGTVFKITISVTTTTTTLTSSPNPSTPGQAVTFTATVGSSVGAPTDGEIVTFKKGYTVLGMGTLSGGSASLTTSMLAVGTSTITATYGGDSTFDGSKSAGVKQVVSP